jgi:hypothetical protein
MYHLQRKPATGGLGLDNHSPATVRFANFYYTKSDAPSLKTVEKEIPPLKAGVVKKWQVSNGFSEKALADKIAIDKEDEKNLKWQTMEAEELGFINIGKYIAKTPEENTVIAKFTIKSGNRQIAKMALGFSDRCRVYLNGKILYLGDNTFKSRDYRFYGTIGFWDEIFLDLQKGKNEVAIAISENFGGWGVEARFDSLNDLAISDR